MSQALIQKRGRVLGYLTKTATFVESIDNQTSIEEIEARLRKLDSWWEEFGNIEDELLLLPQQTSKSDEFETKFFSIQAAMTRELNKRKPITIDNSNHDDLNATISNIYSQQKAYFESLHDKSTNQDKALKLPRINIPPFNGEYTQWPAFKDLYEATVHKNECLSRVHKFQLLKGLLQGSAARAISHFMITDANYDEVWDKLQKRYDNKRSIVSTIIQTFLDQPKIQHTSFSQLRILAETSDELLRGLKAVGPDYESRDPWLLHLLANKLDDTTKQQWALHSVNLESPKVNDFLDFIHRRCDALESFNVNIKSTKHVPRLSHVSTTKIECICCSKPHPLHKCYKFQGFNKEYRRNFVDSHKLCTNCLNDGHSSDNCPSLNTCFRCKSKHHTLLHGLSNTEETKQFNSNLITSNNLDSTETDESVNSSKNVYTSTKGATSENKQTILPTVVMTAVDVYGKIHNIRALLDSGSESTFITADLTKKLGLKRSHACFSVNGLSTVSAGQTRGKINIKLSSRYLPQNFIVVDALILNNLTTYLPSRAILLNADDAAKFHEFCLADPEFYHPQPIEMILGIDVFYDVMKEKRILLKPNLHLLDSVFGWVVAGFVDKQTNSEVHCNTIRIRSEDIYELLQRFWEIQENSFEMPAEDDVCEKHFLKTHKLVNGRYEVELPFKDNCEYIGSTLKQAICRMKSMEKKFYKDPELKRDYVKFMREYEDLGHMERISDQEVFGGSKSMHYLPHHAVIKPSSSTSKLRVVFDGSCKSNTGLSLNDVLRTGPTIQEDLFSILTRFRKHKIAFVSDIENMYRQIRINPKHHDYQRIVWRENPLRPMQHFKLKTVTYGLTCSAYLAIRSLHQAAIDNKEITPKLLNVIKSDFYVDDLLTGCDSINEAVALYNDISNTLSNAGFSLREWSSNNQEFLSNIPIEKHGRDAISIEDPESYIKTLGIYWLTKEDNFAFNIPELYSHQITKRVLLSECGKLFDPLGWLSPVTITFKILLQSLWLRKLEWDDPLPEEINRNWYTIRNQLTCLTDIRIPRSLQMCECEIVQYHGFCDASEKAYSAVVYSRTVHHNGNTFIRLIASKTKVAPLKQLSIPRLELCGAVLLTRLLNKITAIFKAPAESLHAWTDSTIVLSWLSDVPRKWNCFVANRTSFIIERLPNHHWHHIPTNMNPADCASRGLSPEELLKEQVWWNGPDFLKKPETNWPNFKHTTIDSTTSEKRKIVLLAKGHSISPEQSSPVKHVIEKYSSYTTMIRVISYCIKFTELCRKNKLYHQSPYITSHHLKKSEDIIIKWVQNESFREEIHQLQTKQTIKRSSKLTSLYPFIDENGILRVGGRLQNSTLLYSMKHPVNLPKEHQLTDKLLRYLHSKYLHPNPSALLFITRKQYWIIGAKQVIKRISNSCVYCVRTRPKLSEQLMGNLPGSRVTFVRPFTNVGVDYAGPIIISSKRGRGSKRLKAYICLFICMATKAIHIEVVGDLSTDAFIAALRRFTGRRGLPNAIYSDNGTNFVGARRKFDEFFTVIRSKKHNEKVTAYLGTHQIEWHTIPPSAPHFGGLWEAGVKSVKTHIHRVLGESAPTTEELQTLLVQIEAIVNSRPLTPLNEDPDDLNILTPGHFLIGSSLLEVPHADNTDVSVKLSERWQLLQNMARGFWKRWHSEYLTTLQKRSKWQHQEYNFKEGELVLIKGDNLSPLVWARGRVIKIHPGIDGNVRVVSLKTGSGELKRPITKLCKLPIA